MKILPWALLTALTINQTAAQNTDLTQWVDPFIGTANAGNTHPGAVRPWGMVSVAPHNRLQGPTCYVHGEPFLFGFGHLQLSGVGCPGAGSVVLKPFTGQLTTDLSATRSPYSEEIAQPGYYAVRLDRFGVRAEMTATSRSGYSRYRAETGPLNLLLDLAQTPASEKGGALRWVTPTELEGYQWDGNFCDSRLRRQVFFVVRFNQPPDSSGTFLNDRLSVARADSGRRVGAFAQFNDGQVEVRVGLSFVSSLNARINLNAEQGGQSFEALRTEANGAWQSELAKIDVQGGNHEEQTKFYTALYHCLLTPSLYSDVNGDYLTAQTDSTRPRQVRYSPYPRYSVFSLWDTYRTLHPLLCLTHPRQQNDMVRSMIDIFREGGWLPKWEVHGQESWVMVGDPALPVIADTYLKGIREFDVETAFAAMKRNALHTGPVSFQRPGNAEYWQRGFVPIDRRGGTDSTRFSWTNGYVWGAVSTSLEYYYADWTLAQLARALGKKTDERTFLRQSARYATLFDPATKFLRPRLADGRWLEPFNPLARFFDIRWQKSGGHGYVEGTAWNYRFFVPHDIPGLLQRYGKTDFVRLLQVSFDSARFDMSNEPGLSYPYLFNYVPGEEWRTQRTVRDCIDRYFGTSPGGLPGNDDAGTMSAWLVFSMMGFYPDCPGSNQYQLSTPVFSRITLRLDPSFYPAGTFVVTTTGEGAYLYRPPGGYLLTHERLRQGGALVLYRRAAPDPVVNGTGR